MEDGSTKGLGKENGVVTDEWKETIDYFTSWEFRGDGQCISYYIHCASEPPFLVAKRTSQT